MPAVPWQTIRLPQEASRILSAAPSVVMAGTVEELIELSLRDVRSDGYQEVAYEIPGKGRIVEAKVCKVKNGISVNYPEAYMRRRDPDCMVIGDEQPTNKKRYRDRFGTEFESVRQKTFDWLKSQELLRVSIRSGRARSRGGGCAGDCPANAAFFALGLAMLQGILSSDKVADDFSPKALIYIAPPFRHTHFDGRQVVVHNRRDHLHELYSYNLYPGPAPRRAFTAFC